MGKSSTYILTKGKKEEAGNYKTISLTFKKCWNKLFNKRFIYPKRMKRNIQQGEVKKKLCQTNPLSLFSWGNLHNR